MTIRTEKLIISALESVRHRKKDKYKLLFRREAHLRYKNMMIWIL